VSHWGFSLSLTAALLIGFQSDPESVVFKYHILAGVLTVWFLGVRLVLGCVGSKPMRWGVFFKTLTGIRGYLRDVWAWTPVEHFGLNPGSVWFALALYLLVPVVVYTGFIADWAETWHGTLAYGCLFLIGTHLAGLVLHALRHREMSPLAMVHGRGKGLENEGVSNPKTGAGLVLLILGLAVAGLLCRYFVETTSVLQIPFLPEIAFPAFQNG
jgi:cytochrome b